MRSRCFRLVLAVCFLVNACQLFAQDNNDHYKKRLEMIDDWLLFVETAAWNTSQTACHGILYNQNWVITTGSCVRSLTPDNVLVRVSSASKRKQRHFKVKSVYLGDVVELIGGVRSDYDNLTLLELEDTLPPPYAEIHYRSIDYFEKQPDSLDKSAYQWWLVAYMERRLREQAGMMLMAAEPPINIHRKSVLLANQSRCSVYDSGEKWKACVLPNDDSGRTLGETYQKGSALLDLGNCVVGLGYQPFIEALTEAFNFFLPLSPQQEFIESTAGKAGKNPW